MAAFEYEALDAAGKRTKGLLSADSEAAARKEVAQFGLADLLAQTTDLPPPALDAPAAAPSAYALASLASAAAAAAAWALSTSASFGARPCTSVATMRRAVQQRLMPKGAALVANYTQPVTIRGSSLPPPGGWDSERRRRRRRG